ncbi:MAG: response regulator transcription factor [Treponema sp.]|jgi:DNA-binding NarL/FixJ family response regulator|nr:response regulator transcription factor [Treponema sp.]
MISISVIVEQEQERKAICALLTSQHDFQIVDIGKDAYDALKSADLFQPDIIIMDLWIAKINVTELVPIIRRKSPTTKVVAMSYWEDVRWISQAINAGISGLLFKQADLDKLTASVRSVYHDGYYYSALVMNRAKKNYSRAGFWHDRLGENILLKGRFMPNHISVTERNILNYLAKGYSDKEVADNLHIAPGTVRNCLGSVKRRAGLKNRVHVVVNALLHGLIDIQ